MNQRELQNNEGDGDALDSDISRLTALLSALPRVEAPGNFEFRVKASIAGGRTPRTSLVPFLKLVAPLSLVLLVGAFVIFYGTLPSSTDVPAVIDTAGSEFTVPQPSADVTGPPPVTVSGPQISETVASQPERASTTSERSGPVRRTKAVADNRSQGGSIDRTLESANTILPPGFQSVDPRKRGVVPSNVGDADIPVKDVLQMLGVSAELGGDGWKVRSAAANGMAERAGVRAGDVIEAINGTSLAAKTTFKGGVSVKALRVRRDGKQVNLTLGN